MGRSQVGLSGVTHNPKVAGSNPAPATKFIRGASPPRTPRDTPSLALGRSLPPSLKLWRTAPKRLRREGEPFVRLVRCAHSRCVGRLATRAPNGLTRSAL